jgi:DNA polymerase-4
MRKGTWRSALGTHLPDAGPETGKLSRTASLFRAMSIEGGTTRRKIIHIDMDAFYASVEQRDDPELRGKPVAVGGEEARGVVAAASYEARAFGVRSAMPSVIAKRRCPALIVVSPRFDVYRAISSQIREIFAEHTDLIEPLSLDEAYLDVTENRLGIPIASEVASLIRAKINEVTGLNASAGISYCKFLAKMASDLNKPNGQAVITPRMGPAFIEALAVNEFHGVGPVTAAKMEKLRIYTGADLKAKPLAFLQQHFGKSGGWFYQIARGIDDRPVEPDRRRKSIGAESTFQVDIHERDAAREEITPLVETVWHHCEAKQVRARTITLKVKYADFQQVTRSRTVSSPFRCAEEIEELAFTLLDSLFPLVQGIRLIGVTVSSLESQQSVSLEGEQLPLL